MLKKIFLICCLPICALNCLAYKDVDFSRVTPKFNLGKNAALYEQSAKYEINPSTGKQALRLKWNGNKYDRIVLYLPRKMQVMVPSFINVKFQVNVTTTGPCQVRSCNVQLIDANKEIHQYRKRVLWHKASDWKVNYSIDSIMSGTKSIWGGDKNKKLDFPVKLRGIAFELAKNSGVGEIYVNSIRIVSILPKKYPTITTGIAVPLLDPATKPKLLVGNADFTYESNPLTGFPSVKISWKKLRGNNINLSYCKIGPMGAIATAIKLPEFKNAIINIKMTTISAVPVRNIGVVLVDKQGEIFTFSKPVTWNHAGTRTLHFDVDAATPVFQSIRANRYVKNKNSRIDFPVHFAGITTICQRGSSGKLFLDKITLQTTQRLVDAIRLEVETGNPVHVLELGKEKELKFCLTNLLDVPVNVNASFTLNDFNDNKLPWELKKKLSFKPGETKTFVPPKLSTFGIWYLNCHLSTSANGMYGKDLLRSFAYMKPVGATPGKGIVGFAFGINSHPERTPTQIDLEALAVSLVGAKVMRTTMNLPRDFNLFDDIVEKFGKQGVYLDLIINYPRLLKQKGNRKKPDFVAFRKRIRKIFMRYKGKVRYWELMNEPDLGSGPDPTVEDYLKLAKIAKEELDKADADALLISAGFCNFGTPQRGKFHENVMSKGANIFDLHSFHGHADFPTYSKITIDGGLLPMRKRAKVKIPWYSNETALTATTRTEKEQAQALVKKLLFSWSRGSVGYSWYNLRNKGEDRSNGEHNYGMFTLDFYPKPVYVAFNTMTNIFTGKKFIRQIHMQKGLWGFEFKDKNETVFGVWSENYSQDQILIKSDAKSAKVIDLMGNVKPARRLANAIILPVTPEPAFLRLSGGKSIEICAPIIKANALPVIVPGQKISFELYLSNPLEIPITLKFKLLAPSGIHFGINNGVVELPPKSNQKWKTQLTATSDFQVKYGEKSLLSVIYKLNGGAENRLSMWINSAVQFTSKLNGPPLFDLKRRDQIVTMFEADPANLDKLWSSPEDLSAKIWLAVNKNVLLIKAKVTDDKHVQPYTGTKVWKGDNVQVFFQFPGQNGYWELGLTRRDDGINETFAWAKPMQRENVDIKGIKLTTNRNGNTIEYLAKIPFKILGIDSQQLKQGFRFNLLVNDNDLGTREGWIRIAPGVGNSRNFDLFPLLIMR